VIALRRGIAEATQPPARVFFEAGGGQPPLQRRRPAQRVNGWSSKVTVSRGRLRLRTLDPLPLPWARFLLSLACCHLQRWQKRTALLLYHTLPWFAATAPQAACVAPHQRWLVSSSGRNRTRPNTMRVVPYRRGDFISCCGACPDFAILESCSTAASHDLDQLPGRQRPQSVIYSPLSR